MFTCFQRPEASRQSKRHRSDSVLFTSPFQMRRRKNRKMIAEYGTVPQEEPRRRRRDRTDIRKEN